MNVRCQNCYKYPLNSIIMLHLLVQTFSILLLRRIKQSHNKDVMKCAHVILNKYIKEDLLSAVEYNLFDVIDVMSLTKLYFA